MQFTTRFTQLDKNSVPTAGGKGANLGELAHGTDVSRYML